MTQGEKGGGGTRGWSTLPTQALSASSSDQNSILCFLQIYSVIIEAAKALDLSLLYLFLFAAIRALRPALSAASA